MHEKTGDFPRSVITYCMDGLGIIIGALMGSSPVTVFVESATGIRAGGRTGITAITIAFYYFVALWFTPYSPYLIIFACFLCHVVQAGALVFAP